MTKAKNGQGYLLARVNFPLYTVRFLGERHVLVAGGGGMAKTGISNTFEIYELCYDKSLDTCRAQSVAHHDTGRRAIMTSAIFEDGETFILAAGGMDGKCVLYKMKYAVATAASPGSVSPSRRPRSESDEGLRRRRLSSVGSSVEDSPPFQPRTATVKEADIPAEYSDFKDVSFEITMAESFQCDFNTRSGEEAFLKIIRFCRPENSLITGGSDGHIRVWKYPELEKTLDISAHSNEVDDLDVDPTGKYIVSISRDGHGYVWNIKTGGKVCELEYLLPVARNSVKPIKYVFRGVRYGMVEGDPSNVKIFTTLNPILRQKPPNPSYLIKWNTKKYITEKIVSTGLDVVSCMGISDDGRFVGTGALSGTVDVYIAYSLQHLYRLPRAHNIFVTSLEFLKTCNETQALTGDKDVSLVSVSIDNHIVIHHIPKQATLGFLGSTLMFTITLLVIYVLLDLLGL